MDPETVGPLLEALELTERRVAAADGEREAVGRRLAALERQVRSLAEQVAVLAETVAALGEHLAGAERRPRSRKGGAA